MAARTGFERKHFFIDRRLQGRYMLTFLVPMVVMLAFMVFTLYIATQSVVASATQIIREDVDNTVAAALQDREPAVELYQGVIDEVRDHLRMFSSNTRYRRAFMGTLLWVFGLGVLILIVQIVLLTVYFSHKVAGPVYRLERACNNLIDGNYQEHVVLRKGDELQNLAGLLNRVVETTRARLLALRDENDPGKRSDVASALKL